MKYTKEIMEAACSGAKSIAQVCRNLGLKPIGGNYKTVKNNIEKFGIDISHFTGLRWSKGLKSSEEIARIPLNAKEHYCICENCRKEFYSDRIDEVRKFCSRECYNEYLKKISLRKVENYGDKENKPYDLSIESLKKQIEICTSIQQIADNLNSNRTTIRKYLKKYDLYDTFKLKYDFHALEVIQYDINGNKLKEFPSLTDAAEYVDLTGTSGIAKCGKGERRSAGGYLWRYKE